MSTDSVTIETPPGDPAGQPHPDFTKGFNGGMLPAFWSRLADVWYFLEDYGWPILITALVLIISWPHIESYVRQVVYQVTSPPAVQADHRLVERAREQQQRVLRDASRARKEAADAQKREALLANRNPLNKVGSAEADKKKKKKQEGFLGPEGGDSGAGSTYWGSGGGGGGGGGSGYRPSRRRPPGGGGG